MHVPASHATAQARGKRWELMGVILGAWILLALALYGLTVQSPRVHADPIEPPEGYPKFNLSVKVVTPTLAHTGGVTLTYAIQIRNTGAYTATGASLTDLIPEGTTYKGDAQASAPPPPTFANGAVSWTGDVGFDATVVVSFSVAVSPSLVGTVVNTAVLDHPLSARPISVTAETIVTDLPIFHLGKTSLPPKPGANKPLTYTLVVTNGGQPAINFPITVTDRVPLDTTFLRAGQEGIPSPAGDVVTWTRRVTMELGDTTFFTFSVRVADVPSGTVISNDDYQVASPDTGVTAGEPYTVTVVDPILLLSKEVWPDPPGSNREMTYTLTLLNVGSLATNLVVEDLVPVGVVYRRGGTESGGVVSWTWPRLDTGESAQFTFTVYISDVMGISILNDVYQACCAEEVCQAGEVLTSVVAGPTLKVLAQVDPIAHKPGGGTGTEVTPTLLLRNLGPGNALGAHATFYFERFSVQASDLYADPPIGTPPPFPYGPECGEKCNSYEWAGDLGYDETVTFTTYVGQSTIGGGEGTHFTATLVVTDDLANTTTDPMSDTAVGLITHFAHVVPDKTAPPVIGRGQVLTYTISVYNRGLTTELPPILTDVVPMSTTFAWASDSGSLVPVSDTTMVSWILPYLSPGEGVIRRFSVRVDPDLVSGTQIINDDYAVVGYGNIVTGAMTSGPPVTTTVREVGLIDSYKEVTPTLATPGVGIVLTYSLHIVNSGPVPLYGVAVYDQMPWQASTYQRDAVASAGELVSDIVSFHWRGDVNAFSSEVVTFSVLVDAGFQGAVTNTAIISHPSLLEPVVVDAVAYVTNRPVLRISKTARPDPVPRGKELAYTVRVVNLGQQATSLVITDVIPSNTQYVPGSATGGGKLLSDRVRWGLPVLKPGEGRALGFRVTVLGGETVVNDTYVVRCTEGVFAVGPSVVTKVIQRGGRIHLPLILKAGP
jgi:uncharacterized repeat protein (TIGR01451 family)